MDEKILPLDRCLEARNADPILCTVLARGGSKGVPGKNKRVICGKPLLAHTLEVALESKIFNEIAFSSDSDELLSLAERYGATLLIKRPTALASDTSGKLPAIRDCFEQAEKKTGKRFNTIFDLDVTSPMRSQDDIIGVLNLLYTSNASNVITGVPARRSPYFNLVEQREDGCVTVAKTSTTPILRRQDAPKCFDMNASVYAWRRADLERCVGALMDRTMLYEMSELSAFDIDSDMDFEILEFLLNKFWKK